MYLLIFYNEDIHFYSENVQENIKYFIGLKIYDIKYIVDTDAIYRS